MSVPGYVSYRDSGVEWLGAVPDHWKVDRLKVSVRSSKGGIWGEEPDGGADDIICVRVADFDRDSLSVSLENRTMRKVPQKDRQGRVLERGDLLLEKSGGGEKQPVGAVMLYDHDAEAVCSNFVTRIQLAPGQHPLFWRYVHAAAYARGLTQRSLNQTSGIQNLDQGRYLDDRGPFPPPSEQAAIATFLERETGKIDALVEAQRRLIELLKEKRQAVISQAVTKGLDPNAPMKDSGVEWLGEVPAHWEVSAIKRRCVLIKDGTHLPPPRVDEGVPLLSVRNLQQGQFSFLDDDSQISQEDYENLARAFVPKADDVLLAIVGATLGKSALVPHGMGPFYIQRSLALFRPDNGLTAAWLNGVFGSSGFQKMLWQHVGFSAQPGIYLGALADFKIPVPPPAEQNRLVRVLAERVAPTDALIGQAERAVALLRERRSALISSAVTGKIDVRGLVPGQAEAA